MRLELDAEGMIIAARRKARRVPVANRALLRALAIQAQRHAVVLASGPGSAAAGDYPIPIRTGTFRRAFGIEAREREAVLFNTTEYARAIHEGFKPYGNPHATPIPGRPYFDDVLDMLRIDQEQGRWEAAIQ